MIKVSFENFGNIAQGSVNINNITIFTGDNNTGKTYATYAIYSLLDKDFHYKLKEIEPILDILYTEGLYELDLNNFFNENFMQMKSEVEQAFSNSLPFVFSSNENEFDKSKIVFDLDEIKIKERLLSLEYRNNINLGKKDNIVFEAIKEKNTVLLKLMLLKNEIPKDIIKDQLKIILSHFIFNDLFSNSFLLPAERTGLNLFYQELSSKRTAIFHHLRKPEINTGELIKDLIVSSYPQPIADYIDFLNKIYQLKKHNSDFKDLAIEIQKEILKGKYKVEKEGIYFLPYKKDSNKENFNQKISLHLSSSTVKTFFSLVFYLEHLATEGETLIIDEPELNLHPNNQRKIARILAMISNRGVRVIVSTHSDYFVREINNLIILKENFSSKSILMKKYGYSEKMLISDKHINAYLFDKNSIYKMDIDDKEGIIASTFDEVINNLNDSSDEIYYQKEEDLNNAESNTKPSKNY